MGGRCKYYSWDRGDHYCAKLERKVKAEIADKYCDCWDYTDCSVYNSIETGYSLRSDHENFIIEEGGCFLTSACTMAKNRPDDCFELTTLRNYRDGWVKLNHPEDIRDYYITAPKLVQKIRTQPDAITIWENLYESLVLPCVEYITHNQFEKAYSLYKNTTLRLADIYLGAD